MLIDIVVLLIICYFIVIGFRRVFGYRYCTLLPMYLYILRLTLSIDCATFGCICAISENGGV